VTRGRRTRAWIALGSNVGDRNAHLDAAVDALAALPGTRVLARSSWHETEPVGGPAGQGPYLNGAAAIETELDARALLAAMQRIEREQGRDRSGGVRNAPRTLDLDLLVYGDASADARIDEPGLEVPHPRLHEREFVLAPLAEIAPSLVVTARGGSGERATRSVGEWLALVRAARETGAAVPASARGIPT
jgi:2-amino-4-hydroxy-6-hydroxymethyldihydropteridine diphosphokinase